MKPIQLLIKPVSAGCNLNCEYCFYRRVEHLYPKKPTERMSDAILEKMLREHMALRLKQSVYGWQGGEPTLAGLDFFKKVVEYQKRFGAPGQLVGNSLQTNGILLDDEWCAFLAEYKFLIGLSLDGPPDLHNLHRKDLGDLDTHDKVMNAAHRMRRHGVEFNALTVLTPVVEGRAKDIYQWFVRNGFHYMQFIPCCDLDSDTGKPSQWFISPEIYGQFLCDLFDQWYPRDVGKVSVRLFDAMIGYAVDQKMLTWCTFGSRCDEYLLVEYNGDIYPCDFFVYPEWILGSLTTGTLVEAAQSERRAEFARNKKVSQLCKSCRFVAHCHGGCQKDRLLGQDGRSIYCKAYQRFFTHTEEAFRKLGDEVLEMRRQRARQTRTSVGRNDPCPCGSGKKFKLCCGR